MMEKLGMMLKKLWNENIEYYVKFYECKERLGIR